MKLRSALIALTAAGILALASTAFAQDAALVAKGKQVYADQKCSICHSIAGVGNTKGPLDDVGSRLKAEDIRAWIVTPKEMTQKTKAPRKPEMKAYPALPKADLDAVVAYMLSLKK
ncbi:MAG TPA: cytochrome c [Vicinamibacterales bacterium]|nr:cytochrome c [Vicinamibacterales bacterium]